MRSIEQIKQKIANAQAALNTAQNARDDVQNVADMITDKEKKILALDVVRQWQDSINDIVNEVRILEWVLNDDIKSS